MGRPTILAVDDQAMFLFLLEQHLSSMGFTPLTASTATEAYSILDNQSVDLVISDLVMPKTDGLELIEQVKKKHPTVPVVVITGHGSVESAVEAMRKGAFDYITKPYNAEDLKFTIQRALNYHHTVTENTQIKELLRERFTFQSIVTENQTMKKILELATKIVPLRQTILAVYGESGCGKEVLARAIHFAGNGLPGNFVAVNCAAIPENLLESELFGHARGSFTGADRDREGKISAAKGGTLLLDEVGDMPLSLQVKLLRVLQERVFEKIGTNTPQPVECRVIIATSRNLAELVASGNFREDLFHRINVFPLHIPPLRDRKEDIRLLCEHTLAQLRQHLGKPLKAISREAMDIILGYHWPGNVRELRNILERAAILTDTGIISPEHLAIGSLALQETASAGVGCSATYNLTLPVEELSLDKLTRQIMNITLERCNGNKSKAAKLLGIPRKAYYRPES